MYLLYYAHIAQYEPYVTRSLFVVFCYFQFARFHSL